MLTQYSEQPGGSTLIHFSNFKSINPIVGINEPKIKTDGYIYPQIQRSHISISPLQITPVNFTRSIASLF